jgi:hypothetical protein
VAEPERTHTPNGAGELPPDSLRRRPGGVGGAIVAAAMFGLDQALGRKPREEAPVVVDANDNPIDMDRDGLTIDTDAAVPEGATVWTPPQPRSTPGQRARRARRSGRRPQ